VFEQTRNDQTFKLEMTNITWKIPHITPSDFAKIILLKVVLTYQSHSRVGIHILIPNWGMGVNAAGM